MEKGTAGPWLTRLFLKMGAAALAALLLFVLLPGTRPYVPTALSLLAPPVSEPELSGSPALYGGEADALLVVSHEAILRAAKEGRFEAALWSYAWLNLLEQEFGRPAVADVEGLRASQFEGRRLVVLTRSATLAAPAEGLSEALGRFADAGGVVLLEMPGGDWAGLAGVVLTEGLVNPAARTWRGAPLELEALPPSLRDLPGPSNSGPDLPLLRDMPVHTWLKLGLMQDRDVRSLGRLAGQPALYWRPRGRGAVLTLPFDLGFQIQSLQQGTPGGPGWTVPESAGLIPGLVETQDLVASPSMLDNPVPFADLLEGWMASMVEDAGGALPSWWRFPYPFDGVLAVSHDEEEQGLVGFGRLHALENSLDVRATVFVLPGEDLGRRWPDSADDVELHWNRFMQGQWPPYRSSSLAEQVAQVGRVRGTAPRLCRIHYLAWGSDYAAPFRRMAAAGLELDTSYGPNRGRGYLFGTGLPFRALDANGLPLATREWPFVAQEDWSGVDAGWVGSLLEDSARSFHQAPVLLLHPHKWVAGEEGRAYLEEVVEAARRRRHWLAPMAEYHRFLQLRGEALATSRLDGEDLVADLVAPGPGLALRLPGRAQGVLLDGSPARTRRLRSGDRWHVLVEVPPGAHRLTARVVAP